MIVIFCIILSWWLQHGLKTMKIQLVEKTWIVIWPGVHRPDYPKQAIIQVRSFCSSCSLSQHSRTAGNIVPVPCWWPLASRRVPWHALTMTHSLHVLNVKWWPNAYIDNLCYKSPMIENAARCVKTRTPYQVASSFKTPTTMHFTKIISRREVVQIGIMSELFAKWPQLQVA